MSSGASNAAPQRRRAGHLRPITMLGSLPACPSGGRGKRKARVSRFSSYCQVEMALLRRANQVLSRNLNMQSAPHKSLLGIPKPHTSPGSIPDSCDALLTGLRSPFLANQNRQQTRIDPAKHHLDQIGCFVLPQPMDCPLHGHQPNFRVQTDAALCSSSSGNHRPMAVAPGIPATSRAPDLWFSPFGSASLLLASKAMM